MVLHPCRLMLKNLLSAKHDPIEWRCLWRLFGETDLITLKKYADEIENDFYNSGIISK